MSGSTVSERGCTWSPYFHPRISCVSFLPRLGGSTASTSYGRRYLQLLPRAAYPSEPSAGIRPRLAERSESCSEFARSVATSFVDNIRRRRVGSVAACRCHGVCSKCQRIAVVTLRRPIRFRLIRVAQSHLRRPWRKQTRTPTSWPRQTLTRSWKRNLRPQTKS